MGDVIDLKTVKARDTKRGNARIKQADYSDGPWMSWPETDLAERAAKFISTYCRAPKGYGHGEPLKLAPFQEDWLRRILAPDVSAAVDQVPRGNGKSTFHAALALWALFDRSDSGAPQIPIIATTVGQAIRSVFAVATAMVRKDPSLEERSIIYGGAGATRIDCAQTEGTCFPIANSVDGLQGLDPSLAIVDEIGFQPLEAWNSVVLASGKRPRSLVVGVGTPGFDRDNALWILRERWMSGGKPEGFVFREHAAPDGCDHRDESIWYQANPALAAGYQNIKHLRTAVEMTPEAHFRIFHLGQWVDGTEAWLGVDGRKTWMSLADTQTRLSRGAPTWVGLDVGLKRDSTALVVGQHREDATPFYTCKIWMPTRDETVDLSGIMQHIRELDRLYDLQEVAYDPRLFELPGQMLAEEGIPMVEMPQHLDRMSPAFASLYEAIKRGEIAHDGAPDFAAQVLNGVMKFNERGFTLMKSRSRGKIDAAYALCLCHARMERPVKKREPMFIM